MSLKIFVHSNTLAYFATAFGACQSVSRILYYTILDNFVRFKHSSLFFRNVTDESNKFYSIDTLG